MNRRPLLLLGLLAAFATPSRAGVGDYVAPVLPEVRQDLDDGWACLKSDPKLARDLATAVLMGHELTMEVDFQRVPRERRTACRLAVDEALEAWQAALDGLKLSRVPDGERSGIVIRFQPDVREEGTDVAGYVEWERQAGEEVKGTARIRTVDTDGTPLSERAMRNVALHEVGHLLGLDDTDREGEAMSPLDVENPVSKPTDEEVAAVRALRAEAERLIQSSGP